MYRDLAEMYGVSTKALNQAVKRNIARFPDDFVFRLTATEKNELVTICDRFTSMKHASCLPNVFTEHGTLMAANILRSQLAIRMSLLIIRVFVRLREMVLAHKELSAKIESMEKKYDSQFKVVFEAIRQLIEPASEKKKEKIGFHR